MAEFITIPFSRLEGMGFVAEPGKKAGKKAKRMVRLTQISYTLFGIISYWRISWTMGYYLFTKHGITLIFEFDIWVELLIVLKLPRGEVYIWLNFRNLGNSHGDVIFYMSKRKLFLFEKQFLFKRDVTD